MAVSLKNNWPFDKGRKMMKILSKQTSAVFRKPFVFDSLLKCVILVKKSEDLH